MSIKRMVNSIGCIFIGHDIARTDYSLERWCRRCWKRLEDHKPTTQEIAEALKNFKPKVPLSYVLAARKAIKNK